MQVEWYGQSTFRLAGESQTVVIDPFGDMSGAAAHGLKFEYPPIEGLAADLLLVTHEHGDHNAVEVVAGEPVTLRATAGTHESPVGPVVGIASEHDQAAGTERGPNTIFVFDLDNIRVAHFGDLGQSELRDPQIAALQGIDLLILPVGGGPTIGAEQAKAIVDELSPRWVVPMHYRTHRVNFLEPADPFLALFSQVHTLGGPSFDTGDLPSNGDGPVAVHPAAP